MTHTNGNGHRATRLSERAFLCSVSISMWGNRKQDKTLSREAAASRGMGDKVGCYSKWLLIEDEKGTPVREYVAIENARNKARLIHNDMSAPWLDNGTRINSAENFPEWTGALRRAKQEFMNAVEFFLQEYPGLVEKTKSIMDNAASVEGKPSMFSDKNYPGKAALAAHFRFEIMVQPLGEAKDFRIDMADAQAIAIESERSAIQNVTSDLLSRLNDVVGRVVHLGDPKATIQTALIRDLTSVCKLTKRLNIANDPALEDFANRIEKDLQVDPVLLKTAPSERSLLADRAKAILNDMAGYGFMLGGLDNA